MSWPGIGPPGWMMGNEKGIRFKAQSGSGSGTQVRKYVRPVRPVLFCCVYDVLRSFLPLPLRQRGKPRRRTTAKYRQGGLILSQISPCFFPSLGLSFSRSRFKIHRYLASSRIPSLVSPGFCPVWVVCLFSTFPFLPSFAPSPGSLTHLFLTSLLPNFPSCPVSDVPLTALGNVSHLTPGLDGLVQPTCFSPAHLSTNTLSNQLLSTVELFCGLILSHEPGALAVSADTLLPGASLERNNITPTTSYPAWLVTQGLSGRTPQPW